MSSPLLAIALTYCDSGRCTNGSITPGAELLHRRRPRRGRAPIRQYCSSRMWSIDPAAVRRLQQRVVQEEQRTDRPARARARSRRSRLGARRCARTRGTRRPRRTRRRETAARRRRRGRTPDRPPRSRATCSCAIVGSTPDDAARRRRARPAARSGLRRVPTSSTRCAPARHSRAQRQDLFFVLGVGAVGEAVLPPAGVASPRVRRSTSVTT